MTAAGGAVVMAMSESRKATAIPVSAGTPAFPLRKHSRCTPGAGHAAAAKYGGGAADGAQSGHDACRAAQVGWGGGAPFVSS